MAPKTWCGPCRLLAPVLRKDFTVSALDVCDARLDGCRRRVADRGGARPTTSSGACWGWADRLSMTALVEVHDEHELARALDAGADVIGVNQRDLHTFEVDHHRALTLGTMIPSAVVGVAESGIRGGDDVDAGPGRLPGGAGGGDPGPVGRPSGRGGCAPRGRTVSAVDAEGEPRSCSSRSAVSPPRPMRLLAVGMGASAVGFVFAPSPRQMAPAAVADIVKRLPHETVTVGVFRDEAPRRVIEIANQIGLQAVQLHGVESIEDTQWIAGRVCLDDQGVSGRPPQHRAIRGVRCPAPDDRRRQPGRRRAVRLAPGRGGDRSAAADRLGWAPARKRRGGHRPSPPLGGRRVQRRGVLARGEGSRASSASSWRPLTTPPGRWSRPSERGAADRRPRRWRRAPRTATAVRLAERVMASEVMGDPGPSGRFGQFGGRFVPESLVPACLELEAAFRRPGTTPASGRSSKTACQHFGGRPTPVTRCERLSAELGVQLFLKREDLAHTGSHKLNNVIGQALLARRMGKRRLIAETGAGQHGVATATAAALFGMECVVYMGEVDMHRQELNVFRMELLGAEVRSVSSGSRTLKDAVNEALRDWVASVGDSHYCLGLGDGPAPVSVDGPRVPTGDRRGGARAVPGAPGRGQTPMWWWPAPGEDPTRRGSSPGSPTPPTRRWWRWRRPGERR